MRISLTIAALSLALVAGCSPAETTKQEVATPHTSSTRMGEPVKKDPPVLNELLPFSARLDTAENDADGRAIIRDMIAALTAADLRNLGDLNLGSIPENTRRPLLFVALAHREFRTAALLAMNTLENSDNPKYALLKSIDHMAQEGVLVESEHEKTLIALREAIVAEFASANQSEKRTIVRILGLDEATSKLSPAEFEKAAKPKR